MLRLILYPLTIALLLSACQKKELSINEIRLNIEDTLIGRSYSQLEVNNKHSGRIKRRGGYSFRYAKHSFEIKLNKKTSLGGLPADKDWILNVNYIDKTFLRHVISYELFAEMSPHNISPKTTYTDVYINDHYNGLYVLMEKMDNSSLKINDPDSSSFIFKEPHLFRKTYPVKQLNKPNFHHQTYPPIAEVDHSPQLEKIRALILHADSLTFQRDIQKIFDLNNIIDWHLLLLMSNNGDGILKNFYLYKKDHSTPIRVAPWDYDHSFGRDGDNELNLDTRPLDIHRSILFDRLLMQKWYRDQLLERWKHLNKLGLLSKKGLIERVLTKSNNIKRSVLKNSSLWPYDSPHYFDNNNFDQEIAIMLDFIEKRHDRLREAFNKK